MDQAARRKRPVHWLPEPEHACPIVFLTCCSKDRRRCLDRSDVHQALCDAWRTADHWRVGRYVVMPDHIHLFCSPMPRANALDRWIAYWRSLTTRSLGLPKGYLWQREYWDRQLRRQESYSEKWDYVRHNPVRAGLVDHPEDWPFQGELNRLEWLGLA
jgi:putative transposase